MGQFTGMLGSVKALSAPGQRQVRRTEFGIDVWSCAGKIPEICVEVKGKTNGQRVDS